MLKDNSKLFSEEFLLPAVQVFKEFALKSLENQSCHNFEIVLMIHNDIDLNNKAIQELFAIESPIKINIIRYKDINLFIEEQSKDCKYLITTKMDHDDLIYNNFVKDLQNINKDKDIILHWHKNGGTMVGKDVRNVYEFKPNYNGEGCINLGCSLIVDLEKVDFLKSIMELGGMHTKIKLGLDEKCKGHKNTTAFIEEEKTGPAWLYVKHDFNHSTNETGHIKMWHRSFIKINKDKTWFKNRFGINI